jgi:PTS system N-acetylglucosamine-specific IIC component
MLIPVGAAYFAIYYAVFRTVIARFDLKTPGRETEPVAAAPLAVAAGDRARGFVAALGGAANLRGVEACTTRLRLVVADQALVDEAGLKALGSRGLVRPSGNDLQVVLVPQADDVAREIREALAAPTATGAPSARAMAEALGGAGNIVAVNAASSRVRLALKDPAKADEAKLRALGVRALARPAAGALHLILGPAAEPLAIELAALVA